MANRWYSGGKEGILDESIRLKTGEIRWLLIADDYKFNREHRFEKHLGESINAVSRTLENKSFSNGVFDADDSSMVVRQTEACSAIVLIHDVGHSMLNRLIIYVDNPTDGLPKTMIAGRRVVVEHNNGTEKIFKI